MENSQSLWSVKNISIAIVCLFFLLSCADIFREYRSGETLEHLTFEITVTIISFVWFSYLWVRWYKAQQELRTSHQKVLRLNEENLRWKKENERLLSGLSLSIDAQLNAWKLSPAEKEVALLLLKGLSFKEIAEIRGTSEKTTRQQSTTIYQKSSLPGRAELSAFFLEDLLGPKNLP